MDAHHVTPSGFGTSQRTASSSWTSLSSPIPTPDSTSISNHTYLLPTSPAKRSRSPSDMYKPRVAKTCGQRPACLANASVTYCGNNQIYAFGGFDQYTDEGIIKPQNSAFFPNPVNSPDQFITTSSNLTSILFNGAW